MQTIQEYADEIAAGDKGQWRAATRRAAQLIGHRHPTVDLSRRIPLTQILLQATSLIFYGLAVSDSRHPVEVSPLVVSNWAADRMLPLPPHSDGPLSDTQWVDADRQ